jgi:hypothetical protein
MAFDILLIPAMSADPKRLFSGAKITISDRRNRFNIYTIKALECLKSWLKIKAFKKEDNVNKGYKNTYINNIRQKGAIQIN